MEAVEAGTYPHFEETLFGTANALQSVNNGPAHVAANGPLVQAAALVAGFRPQGCYVNALVIEKDPAAAAALTAHSGIPGAVIPNGRPGNGATNRAGVAAVGRGEKPLFMGIFPHNALVESTVNIGCRIESYQCARKVISIFFYDFDMVLL